METESGHGSEFVDVVGMEWQPTPFPGVDMKLLYQAPEGGFTALFRAAPGARLPLHRHTGVEQSFVIEGSLVDDEGACTSGNFVWRHAGSIHEAHTPDGVLAIGIFESPNEFLEPIETE
ncbi:MAG: cupin domain-containing protein [Planctomycetaceae bacterium]